MVAVALGSAPLEYSLISNLTESEPIATYVRPKQFSNRFSGLDAGDYYMRIYNACGNASTIPFTVDQDLSNPNVIPMSGRFIAIGCDSVSFTFRVNEFLKNTINFPSDVNVKAWVKWPNGSVDTITLPNQANTSLLTPLSRDFVSRAHISYIDPLYNPTTPWPNNLTQPSYPIEFGFIDACGVIHTDVFTFIKPSTTAIVPNALANHTASDCDNIAYRFMIRQSSTGATTTTQGFAAYHGFRYSLMAVQHGLTQSLLIAYQLRQVTPIQILSPYLEELHKQLHLNIVALY